jgi:hypothetical protein
LTAAFQHVVRPTLGNRLNSQSEKGTACSPQSNLRRADLLTVAQSVLTFSAAQRCDPCAFAMEQIDELQNHAGADLPMDQGLSG